MTRVALLSCLAALLAAGSAAGQGSAPDVTEAGAGKIATFKDAAGEDPQGPDINVVTVSNDDSGLLTFHAGIPARPALTDGMRFRIWIDSDANAATGLDVNGMDYFLLHERAQTGLWRCGGTVCAGGAQATTLEFAYRGGPLFSILDAEIGNPKRLRFAIEAATGILVDPETKTVDASNARFDDAPARGETWTYTLGLGPQRLIVTRLATSPVAPRAGAPFRLRVAVMRADTGALLSSGRVRCSARIAGRSLRPRSAGFEGRRAVCVFGIPSDAARATIRFAVRISFGGKTATRVLIARVRS